MNQQQNNEDYIKENDKIVLMCNYGFRDMTMNLLKCFDRLNISKSRYFLYAMDDKAHEFFLKKNIECIRFSREETNRQLSENFKGNDNEGVYGEDAESYGNVGFRALCNEKPLVVLDVLKKGYNVLWTDTDIVWKQDPFIHFYRDINKKNGFTDQDIDLYVQQDDDDICAGFYFIRSNSRTIKYIQDTIEFLNPLIDDQISMRLFLKSQGINILSNNTLLNLSNEDKINKIRYKLLDKKLFPNGTNYFNLKLPQRDNIEPYIIHNNCIIGHRSKKERFIEYDLWYIDDEKDLLIDETSNVNDNDTSTILQCKQILKNHTDIITSLNSSNGKLYSTSIDKTIKIWEINVNNNNNLKLLKSKYIHRRGGIWSTYINDEDNSILTASHDKSIQQWNKDLESIQTFTGHSGIINQMIVIPNSNYFLTCSDDNTIRQYNLKNLEFKRVFLGHNGWVSSIAINNNILYSCSNDGTIRYWDLNSGRCLNIIKANQGNWIRKIIYKNELNQLISVGNDSSTIKIWSCDQNDNHYNDNKPMVVIDTGINDSSINDIQFDQDTNLLYCAFENGSLRSFNLKTNKLDKIYQGHQNSSINCIHISKSLNLLLSGGFDKQIKSWDL